MLLSSNSSAERREYICEFKAIYQINDESVLKNIKWSGMISKKFTINKKSGVIENITSAPWLYKDSVAQVISEGSENSSLTILYTADAALGGVHSALVRIEEFNKNIEKPFIVSSGSNIYLGTCL